MKTVSSGEKKADKPKVVDPLSAEGGFIDPLSAGADPLLAAALQDPLSAALFTEPSTPSISATSRTAVGSAVSGVRAHAHVRSRARVCVCVRVCVCAWVSCAHVCLCVHKADPILLVGLCYGHGLHLCLMLGDAMQPTVGQAARYLHVAIVVVVVVVVVVRMMQMCLLMTLSRGLPRRPAS